MDLRDLIESKDFLEESINETDIVIKSIKKDDLVYIFRNINDNATEKLEDDRERCKFMIYKHRTYTDRYIRNVHLLIKKLLEHDRSLFKELPEEHVIQIFVYLNYDESYHNECVEFIKLFEDDKDWLERFIRKDTYDHCKLPIFDTPVDVNVYLLVRAMQYDALLYDIDHCHHITLYNADSILQRLRDLSKLKKKNTIFMKRLRLLIKILDKLQKRSEVCMVGNLEHYEREIEIFDASNPSLMKKKSDGFFDLTSMVDYDTIKNL
ncbi:hypothetical protein GUITHDRAFT_133299 [Guillardia theta CCMP2712]|uniref:Uncharacterized protein n=1 Tax=Guillardia theta (strain CCMP2712) TaxID=905079 RepID=L1JXF5_GUITC|nr:hypothetical protein GUITHDRAFT_133299 [Guillardia theta CCMP2712]EKX52885.1 hypothetical protein GUITHDRAFT_133299 [Guillardia theta CCMP2712]|eukprot:XP_005839865.1 hypothetical protein GUITHDRAFT_133299 [Guillardia theta CCMP2712]